MVFSEIVRGAIDLGVIPIIALFLIYSLVRSNRQLQKNIEDLHRQRHEVETKLLETQIQIVLDTQAVYRKYQQAEQNVSNGTEK